MYECGEREAMSCLTHSPVLRRICPLSMCMSERLCM